MPHLVQAAPSPPDHSTSTAPWSDLTFARREIPLVGASLLLSFLTGCGSGSRQTASRAHLYSSTLEGAAGFYVCQTASDIEVHFEFRRPGSYVAQGFWTSRGSVELLNTTSLSAGESICGVDIGRATYLQVVRAGQHGLDCRGRHIPATRAEREVFFSDLETFRTGQPCRMQAFTSGSGIIIETPRCYGVVQQKTEVGVIRLRTRASFVQLFAAVQDSISLSHASISLARPAPSGAGV